ncbi:MAG: DUF4129 domain-containing protein [Flavobacteriales bacterium]|nr:DUF4129 domain-containing protein [Flavobacteriales bacterium]
MTLKRKVKNQLFSILFVVVPALGWASDTAQHYTQRYFDPEIVNSYRDDRGFSYAIIPEPSYLSRFLSWLNSFGNDSLSGLAKALSGIFSEDVYTVFIWVVALGAAGMLIKSLIAQGVFKSIKRAPRKAKIVYGELQGDEEIDWLPLIENEIELKRYKTAVRLLYLYTIKSLSDKDLITFKKDKTNREYARELEKAKLLDPFKTLTRAYNYVWFGDFRIDEQRFQQIRTQFNIFNSSAK